MNANEPTSKSLYHFTRDNKKLSYRRETAHQLPT